MHFAYPKVEHFSICFELCLGFGTMLLSQHSRIPQMFRTFLSLLKGAREKKPTKAVIKWVPSQTFSFVIQCTKFENKKVRKEQWRRLELIVDECDVNAFLRTFTFNWSYFWVFGNQEPLIALFRLWVFAIALSNLLYEPLHLTIL